MSSKSSLTRQEYDDSIHTHSQTEDKRRREEERNSQEICQEEEQEEETGEEEEEEEESVRWAGCQTGRC